MSFSFEKLKKEKVLQSVRSCSTGVNRLAYSCAEVIVQKFFQSVFRLQKTNTRTEKHVADIKLQINSAEFPWRAFSVNQFCRIFLQIFVEFKKCRIYKSYSNCKHWNCQNKNLRKQRFLAFHRLLLFLTVLLQLFFLNKPSS